MIWHGMALAPYSIILLSLYEVIGVNRFCIYNLENSTQVTIDNILKAIK